WNAQSVYRLGAIQKPSTPQLQPRKHGSFKIVQFADIHMATGEHTCFNALDDKKDCVRDIDTMDMINQTSGHNVGRLTSTDAYSTILKFSWLIVDRKLPWAIIFDNNAEEGDLSREETIQLARDVPYSLSERGPVNIWGTRYYVLRIWPSSHHQLSSPVEKEEQHQFALYFLNSGAYRFNLEQLGRGCIKESQVEWFRQQSATLTAGTEAVKGDLSNALASLHIPIHEYDPARKNDDDDDDDADGDDNLSLVGEKRQG
ncbi:hypothetical protein DFQ26_001208, partial [Actinomortierella ambigua]